MSPFDRLNFSLPGLLASILMLSAPSALAQLAVPAPNAIGLGTVEGFVFKANAVSDDGGVVVGERWGQLERSAGEGGIVDGAVRWTPPTGAATQLQDARSINSYWEVVNHRYVAIAGDGSDALLHWAQPPFSFSHLRAPDGSYLVGSATDGDTAGLAVANDGGRYVSSGWGGRTFISEAGSVHARILPPAFEPGGSADTGSHRVFPTGASGNLSRLVGRFQPTEGPGSGQDHSFLWTETGGAVHFLPDEETFELRLSEQGDIVVGGIVTDAGDQLFRWTEAGGIQLLGVHAFGAPDVVSDDGGIVAFSDGLWTTTTGYVDLTTYLATVLGLDLSEWQSMGELRDMSPNGNVLLGFGINASGAQESWLVVIPEPGTALLLGLGLGIASRTGRRR